MGALRQQADIAREIISQATSALLEYLSEQWILAPGGREALELAHVEVSKDWYGPYWSVRFTMEGPPWFGDSLSLEMEELAPGEFHPLLPEPRLFHRRNIECAHQGHLPQGHWRVNPVPRPGMNMCSAQGQSNPPWRPINPSRSLRWPPRGEVPCFAQRPRDLGWADSRHWMEED